MANLTFGNGITDARGSVGGTTFSRNASGAFARARVKGINPQTERQTVRRTQFAGVSSLAKTLPATIINNWRTFAAQFTLINKNGQPFTPSWLMMFQSVNSNLQRLGIDAVTLSPLSTAGPTSGVSFNPAPTTRSAISIAGQLTELRLEETLVAPAGSQELAVISATRPQRQSLGLTSRQMVDLPGVFEVSNQFPLTLTETYTSVFGTGAIAGDRIFLSIKSINGANGIASPEALTFIDVVAST